jgi:hypothetical protein
MRHPIYTPYRIEVSPVTGNLTGYASHANDKSNPAVAGIMVTLG